MSPDLINTILVVLEVALAIIGGFIAALWISLVIWAFRDIRSRSRDIFAQLLATLLVLIFNLPGLLLYILLRPPEKLADAYERALEEEALLQDIEERALCPGCKRQVEQDFLLCPSCHTMLKKRCLNCNRVLHLKWTLCPYCTTDQIRQEPEESSPRGVLEPAYAMDRGTAVSAAEEGGPAGRSPISDDPWHLSQAEDDPDFNDRDAEEDLFRRP